MNKILMILAAMLMMGLNVACSNEEDFQVKEQEWGSKGLIPGELVSSYDNGYLYLLYEQPSTRWGKLDKWDETGADVKWLGSSAHNPDEWAFEHLKMIGLNACRSMNELIEKAAVIAACPSSDYYWNGEEEYRMAQERIGKCLPEHLDFQKQSVFLFYFIGPSKYNTVALFTNPATNKPVFMNYVDGEMHYRLSCDIPSHAGLMGLIVLDAPNLTVKDIEIWSKIKGEDEEGLLDGFDKEFPDWKVKEWKNKIILPDVKYSEYLGCDPWFEETEENLRAYFFLKDNPF